MVIDAREKCESLGIDYRDYSEAVRISDPEVFDFDGPIPGVEAPYPYAGREDGE